jgi:hypothetical protein
LVHFSPFAFSALISVFIELIQIVEIQVVLYALPDVVGGVGFFLREAVDTKKDIARIDQILHERETYLVAMHRHIKEVAVSTIYLFLGDIRRSPAHSDGWHHSDRVTLIAPSRITIFWSPDKNSRTTCNLPTPIEVEVVDAKEF